MGSRDPRTTRSCLATFGTMAYHGTMPTIAEAIAAQEARLRVVMPPTPQPKARTRATRTELERLIEAQARDARHPYRIDAQEIALHAGRHRAKVWHLVDHYEERGDVWDDPTAAAALEKC